VAYEVDLRGVAVARSEQARDETRSTRPLAARRHFLFFFDFRFTTRRGVREARDAALEFLDNKLRGGDVLAVAKVNRFGVDIPIPFTTDVSQARAVIKGISLSDATDRADHFFSRAEMEAEVAAYIESLAWIAELLRAAGGRKHLVMFSTGFPDAAILDAHRALDATVEALIEADVVVHAVDPRGLRLEQDGRQALNLLASGTGGEAYWNFNELDVPLGQIDDATNRYYMIAYAKKASDPPAVSIEVRVAGPGLRVTSAPTRLAPPPAEDEMTDDQKWLRSGEIRPPS
jgi:VWFA-related protein